MVSVTRTKSQQCRMRATSQILTMSDEGYGPHKTKNTPPSSDITSEMVDRFSFDANRDLSVVDPSILSHAAVDRERDLPADFEPDVWTVICSRGLVSFHHEGNVRFRALIDERLDSYTQAQTKMARSVIVSQIVETIRSKARFNAGFVRQDAESKRWFEVTDRIAREKVGQAIRAALKKQDRHEPKKRAPSSSTDEQKTKRKFPSSAGSSLSNSSSKHSTDLHDSTTSAWRLDKGPASSLTPPSIGRRSHSAPETGMALRHPAIAAAIEQQSHSTVGRGFGESVYSLPQRPALDRSQSAFRAEGGVGMRHSEESFMSNSAPRPSSFHRPSFADGLDGIRPSLSFDQIRPRYQEQSQRRGHRSAFDLETSLDAYEPNRVFGTRSLEPLPLSAPAIGESVLSVENLRMIESIDESKRGETSGSSWREFASSMLDHQTAPPGRSHAPPVYPLPDFPVTNIHPVPWQPQPPARQRATSEPPSTSKNNSSGNTEDDSPPPNRRFTES